MTLLVLLALLASTPDGLPPKATPAPPVVTPPRPAAAPNRETNAGKPAAGASEPFLTLKVTPLADTDAVVAALKRDGATITIREPNYIICEIPPKLLPRMDDHGYILKYKVVKHCECPHFGTDLCGHGKCHARGTPCCDECAGKGKQAPALGCCRTETKAGDGTPYDQGPRLEPKRAAPPDDRQWYALGGEYAGYHGYGRKLPDGRIAVDWSCRTGSTEVRRGLPPLAAPPTYYRVPGFFGTPVSR